MHQPTRTGDAATTRAIALHRLNKGLRDLGRRERYAAPVAVYHRHESVAGAGCIRTAGYWARPRLSNAGQLTNAAP